MIRGIRGAITVTNNGAAEILSASEKLLRTMIQENSVKPDAVASILISMTEDLNAVFPAAALRSIKGYKHVPVMCAQEIPVPGSLPKCIRVLMTVNTEARQEEVRHIYLEGAVSLRPDLAE